MPVVLILKLYMFIAIFQKFWQNIVGNKLVWDELGGARGATILIFLFFNGNQAKITLLIFNLKINDLYNLLSSLLLIILILKYKDKKEK